LSRAKIGFGSSVRRGSGGVPTADSPSPAAFPPGPLAEAERRILRYLRTNLSVPEIAAELFCSVNTVKTHIRHMYAKLGARSSQADGAASVSARAARRNFAAPGHCGPGRHRRSLLIRRQPIG
jgi:LuxR family transcriptional regulator, maltose regulon positive regulatory protein